MAQDYKPPGYDDNKTPRYGDDKTPPGYDDPKKHPVSPPGYDSGNDKKTPAHRGYYPSQGYRYGGYGSRYHYRYHYNRPHGGYGGKSHRGNDWEQYEYCKPDYNTYTDYDRHHIRYLENSKS